MPVAFPTRCYAIAPLTPLLALCRNAQSEVPELGAASMARWMEFWRPRIARYVAPLWLGRRRACWSLDEITEHALISMAAQLETCDATTDAELFQWVSVRTTRAVLEHGAPVASTLALSRAVAPARLRADATAASAARVRA